MDFVFALLVLLGTSSANVLPQDYGQVILSSVLYRHGQRTPSSFYPTDPYQDPKYWPEAPGQLLKEGMRGHFELGRFFRKRYIDLLPSEYHHSDIYVRSTNIDRTIMSAQTNLAGLYLPDPQGNWDPSILWRPIPIHTNPQTDSLFYGLDRVGGTCPRYDALFEQFKKEERYQNFIDEYRNVSDVVSAHSGIKNASMLQSITVFDALEIEHRFGYKLPEWTDAIFPEPARTMFNKFFYFAAATPAMARLQMGPLLKEMLERMQRKLAGTLTPDYKIFMYSAHDTSIANFLVALNVYDGVHPPYNSSAILELRRKQTDHFVTLTYRNSSVNPPVLLTIPGCEPLCPFNTFANLLEPLIPEDWKKECQDLKI